MKEKSCKVLPYKTIAVNGSTFLMYRKGALFISNDGGANIDFLANLPLKGKKKLFTRSRLLTRLFRLEPRAASIIDEKRYMISYAGKIYVVDAESKSIQTDFDFRPGMNNPLSFTKVDAVPGFDDGIYFGEYFSNNNQEEVCIYRRTSEEWKKVFAFPKGAIYHIHGIVADRKRRCLYVLTGDEDHESAIWEAKNNFTEVTPILRGKQQYRSCVAFPWNEGFLYATDTAREHNWVYRVWQNNGNWETDNVVQLPGPCIYGIKIGDYCYFATSVEPDESVGSFRYRFTYRLGKGIRERKTHIIRVDSKGNAETVFHAKKDLWPMLLFQFGNCMFPSVEKTNKLIICPISVYKYDGKTIVYE